MAGPSDSGSDFAAILGKAQQLPGLESTPGTDLPDGFPFKPSADHRVVDSSKDPEGIAGVVAYDFLVHRRVFTIFRPWSSCDRCRNALARGDVELPEVGDYECPHVTIREYETVTNEVLAGKLLYGSEQEITQKDGTVLVSLRWYEKKFNPKAAKRAQKEKQRQGGADWTP